MDEIDLKIIEYYHFGPMNIGQTADKVGIDRSNVSRRIDRMGIPKKEIENPGKIHLEDHYSDIKYAWLVKGLAKNTIAKSYEVDSKVIDRILNEMGILKPLSGSDLDNELLRKMHVEEGLDSVQIALKLGAKRTTVDYRLKSMGVFVSPLQHIQKLHTEEDIVLQRFDNNDSCRMIARDYGVDTNAVIRILHKNGRDTSPKTLDQKYDIERFKKMYEEDKLSRFEIAELEGLDPRTVYDCLILAGTNFRDATEQNIIAKSKYDLPEYTHEQKCEIKANSMNFDISPEFYWQFEDWEKMQLLSDQIMSACRSRNDLPFTADMYMDIMVKFYDDPVFNRQYQIYLEHPTKYNLPSFDHQIPVCKFSKDEETIYTYGLEYANSVDNLKCLSFFLNYAKCDMTWAEFLLLVENTMNFEAAYSIVKDYEISIEDVGHDKYHNPRGGENHAM